MDEKIFLNLILSLFIIILISSNALGDGGLYKLEVTYDYDVWTPVVQDKQVGLITYKDGKEILTILVKSKLEGNKLVWIFPIPAEPEKTYINITEEIPKFSGYEVRSKVGYELHKKLKYFTFTQLYPILYDLFFGDLLRGGFGSTSMHVESEKLPEDIGVVIHEHLEKGGLTTELITAKDENKLYSYLKENNLNLPNKSLSLLREYIGKEYSFVISWVSNATKYKEEIGGNTLGVQIEFPTKNIYYPLKLTSIYGENKIPILIYASGHVSPKIYKEIKDETIVNYYSGKERYTKIEINAKTNHFVDDLWINRRTPPQILLADFILFSPTLFLIAIFAIFSCLASSLSGLIVFRGKVPLKKLCLIGLSNFLTLLGFSLATKFAIKEEKSRKSKLLTRISYSWILLTIILLILAWALQSETLLGILLIFLFLSPFALIGVLTETPGKFAFVAVFSIVFLMLSVGFICFIRTNYPYKVEVIDFQYLGLG